MSYSQQTWQDGVTPVDAERMNHIEDGIADVGGGVDSLNSLFERFNLTQNGSRSIALNANEFCVIFMERMSTGRSGIYLVYVSDGVVAAIEDPNITVGFDSGTVTITNLGTSIYCAALKIKDMS